MKEGGLNSSICNATDMPSTYHMDMSLPIKASWKVSFPLVSLNLIRSCHSLTKVIQTQYMKKESKIFSINWGNMPGHSWEKTTESTVLFLQSLSWLMLHFHGHMLLSSSLVPKFQNLCFPASQLVIWRAGKRKSRGTSTASQHQGWLLHDQREWN